MRSNLTERIGVYQSALVFTKEIKWIFREQPLVDVGIDALIEETVNGEPKGKFLAAQIKSGEGNFHMSEKKLTLYVSKIHYHYWLNLNIPIILIASIEDGNHLCWEQINTKTLHKTKKRWKIDIKLSKILCAESRSELSMILQGVTHENSTLPNLLSTEVSQDQIDKLLMESGKMKELAPIIIRMNNVMSSLTDETKTFTAKIILYKDNGITHKSKLGKKLIYDLVNVIESAAEKLDTEIDLFANKFSIGFRNFEQLSLVYFNKTKDYQSLQDTYNSIQELTIKIEDALKGIKLMRNSASALPRNIPRIDRARLKYVESSNSIISEYKIAKETSEHLAKKIYEMLN